MSQFLDLSQDQYPLFTRSSFNLISFIEMYPLAINFITSFLNLFQCFLMYLSILLVILFNLLLNSNQSSNFSHIRLSHAHSYSRCCTVLTMSLSHNKQFTVSPSFIYILCVLCLIMVIYLELPAREQICDISFLKYYIQI